MSPPKKPKKHYDVLRNCQDVWTTKFPWVKMLKSEIGEVHHVKCTVRSFVKCKDVILGPKAYILKKHEGKTRVYLRHATFGQEIRRLVCQ